MSIEKLRADTLGTIKESGRLCECGHTKGAHVRVCHISYGTEKCWRCNCTQYRYAGEIEEFLNVGTKEGA